MSPVKRTKIVTIILLATLLSACNLPEEQQVVTPTPNTTSVASTVLASFTQTAQIFAPTLKPTGIESPESTADIPTAIEASSQAPTSTIIPTVTPGACDNETFVADVTVPDGTQFGPNTEFVKSWRIRNTGGCTWTTSYKLIFGYGDRMGGVSVKLDKEVKPGEEIEISITLRSPANTGDYAGYWRLMNDKGYPFGQFLSVIIKVPKP
jgi:hypothetical protein